MSEANGIKLFENKQIRAAWNDDAQKWYFSIVDTCEALSDTENPRRYWSDLKRKLKAEGATQLYENIVQLKLQSADGKNYKTDVADMEQLLRLIQSINGSHRLAANAWKIEPESRSSQSKTRRISAH